MKFCKSSTTYQTVGSAGVTVTAGYNDRSVYAKYTATADVDVTVSGRVYYAGSGGETYSQAFTQKSYGEFSRNYSGNVTRITAYFDVTANDATTGKIFCDAQ